MVVRVKDLNQSDYKIAEKVAEDVQVILVGI